MHAERAAREGPGHSEHDPARSMAADRRGPERRRLDHQERLRTLTAQLALAEENERRRIASLLHDDVGHSLALAQIRLGRMQQEGTEDVRAELAPVRELIAEAIEATRSLTFELSSPVLYELGLEAALESVVDRLAQATDVRFDFTSESGPKPLSEDGSVLLFRSAREILLNIVKHARARCATVTVRRVRNEIRIRVTDDGVGFDVARVMDPAGSGMGHGLLSAVAQVRSLGGSLEVEAMPGAGTSCLIIAPLELDAP